MPNTNPISASYLNTIPTNNAKVLALLLIRPAHLGVINLHYSGVHAGTVLRAWEALMTDTDD
jgi:hypothetical protein